MFPFRLKTGVGCFRTTMHKLEMASIPISGCGVIRINRLTSLHQNTCYSSYIRISWKNTPRWSSLSVLLSNKMPRQNGFQKKKKKATPRHPLFPSTPYEEVQLYPITEWIRILKFDYKPDPERSRIQCFQKRIGLKSVIWDSAQLWQGVESFRLRPAFSYDFWSLNFGRT